ncbi:cartilage matrix protein-like, partial [Scomber scombrus]
LQAEDDHQSGSQCDSKAEADIVLLVGTSESVASEDFSNIKSFLTQVVSIFDIGSDKVQIGNMFTTTATHTTAPGSITTTKV